MDMRVSSGILRVSFEGKKMHATKILNSERLRTNEGSFGYIPHRFLRGGFFERCTLEELCVYLFLVLVADKYGVSFYTSKKTSRLCSLSLTGIKRAYDGLIMKDLIETDGYYTQVLSLPANPADAKVKRITTDASGGRGRLVPLSEVINSFVKGLSRNGAKNT